MWIAIDAGGNPAKEVVAKDGLAVLTIVSPDEPNPQVIAQYNPKEIQIDRTVPWGKHGTTGSPKKSGQSGKERGMLSLEFTGTEPRTVTVELLFDGFEDNRSVAPTLEVLEQLATVRDPDSKKEEMLRPYRCIVIWGETLRNFRCVIESLSIKYTMMAPDGTPLRATATVKLKEVNFHDR